MRRPKIKDDRSNISQERLQEMADNIKLASYNINYVMNKLPTEDYVEAWDICYEALYQTVKIRHYKDRPEYRDNYDFALLYRLQLTAEITDYYRKISTDKHLAEQTLSLEQSHLKVKDENKTDEADLRITINKILETYNSRQKFIIELYIEGEFKSFIREEYNSTFNEKITASDVKETINLFKDELEKLL